MVFSIILPLVGCKDDKGTNTKREIPGGAGNPALDLVYVPAYGTMNDLKGQVWHVDPAEYKIAVYIFNQGWWTKPYPDKPLTSIQSAGVWSCDVTTSQGDEKANRLAAFLFPNGYSPPLMAGDSILPAKLFQDSESNVTMTRTAGGHFRTLEFAGYEWNVKESENPVGPGPNYFSAGVENVWIDKDQQLHLRISLQNGRWYCAEIVSQRSFGFGKYAFQVEHGAYKIDKNAVLGLFTWDDAPEYTHREIDVEISRWGQDANDNSQYVIQPWDRPGNIHRFNAELTEGFAIHSFDWRASSIRFQGLHNNALIQAWTYTGQDIPMPGNENTRLNLWLIEGRAPSDGKPVEVIIGRFEFTN